MFPMVSLVFPTVRVGSLLTSLVVIFDLHQDYSHGKKTRKKSTLVRLIDTTSSRDVLSNISTQKSKLILQEPEVRLSIDSYCSHHITLVNHMPALPFFQF